MEQYNYMEAIKADIRDYLESEGLTLTEDNFDEVHDTLWIEDSVTGNASGSYTFSTWEAEENLCHNRDLMEAVALEWGKPSRDDPESWDVAIRCYLLADALRELLDELEAAA